MASDRPGLLRSQRPGRVALACGRRPRSHPSGDTLYTRVAPLDRAFVGTTHREKKGVRMDWRWSRSRRRPSLRPSETRGIERLESREVPATVPPGFTATLVANGLGETPSMDIAPDGRVFVTEEHGSVA